MLVDPLSPQLRLAVHEQNKTRERKSGHKQCTYIYIYRERERERERETETETETERQTDRQRQRQTDRQTETDRQRQRQRDRQTDSDREIRSYILRNGKYGNLTEHKRRESSNTEN